MAASDRPTLPEHGRPKDELVETLSSLRKQDADWRGGKVWSLVYHAGDEHEEVLRAAHELYLPTNFLNPMVFKSLKTMESEVVRMTASLLNAPPDAVGTMTSGGTESILLAVKAARDRARRRRPWILNPEIVAPESIHVAMDKAAHYFGLKVRYAPLRDDFRVDVKAMKKLINKNTVLVAASAPQYPHGVIDPIAEIGAIAKKKKLPFHVDGCVGGFVLPFIEALGHPIPPFDFRVEGVTSMSADVHKYGFASKGASILLYRDMSYMKHQFFVSTNWPGGIYASATMPGTRPGGPIAGAWASMMSMGREGYLDHTRRALAAAQKLREGIRSMPELKLLGDPETTIVTIGASDPKFSVFAVADQLGAKGWHVDRQQHPDSIHHTVMSNHEPIVDEYLADLREAVAHVRAHPELQASGEAAMYGMMAKVPARSLVRWSVGKVMEQMYAANGGQTDLGNLGDDADGPLMKAMAKYGPQALGVLDRLEGVRGRLGLGRRRRNS